MSTSISGISLHFPSESKCSGNEKIDYFSGTSYKNDLAEIVDLLFRDEMVIAGRTDELKNLTKWNLIIIAIRGNFILCIHIWLF